jgi:hypothetical protein
MTFKNVCFTLHVCDVRTVNIYCRNYRMCYTLANVVQLKNIQWTSFLCSSMNIYSIYVCACLSVLWGAVTSSIVTVSAHYRLQNSCLWTFVATDHFQCQCSCGKEAREVRVARKYWGLIYLTLSFISVSSLHFPIYLTNCI